ncbi:sensor histidine kinase [Streptomyces sp. NPDC090022]|uniref:sensor histidine kinase n=1 Tax=Streptomyces sp. NPDC090022 TaxID=3365920 RepID=UPI00382B466F
MTTATVRAAPAPLRRLRHPAQGPGDPSLTLQSLTLQANALQALCRQVFGFRLAMLALGAPVALGRTAPGGPLWLVSAAILLTFMFSYVLFRDWERWGPRLLRHRWALAVDMGFSALLLVTATPESPLGLVCGCTPLLAGLVYGWRGSALYAAAQAVLVAGVYALDAASPVTVTGAMVLPGLCVIAGAAGACLRGLLFRFGTAGRALTETRARLAVAEAVAAERARLAREMHDSVSKTLHGVALAAEALAAGGTADPRELRAQARLIAGAARRAAAESRDLLADLRADLDAPVVSLAGELRCRAGAFASEAGPGLAVEVEVDAGLPPVPGAVARELSCVVGEALENTRRHAGASRVAVSATADGDHLTLLVRDDGRGLGAVALAPDGDGRFGILGMRERAEAAGGRLTLGAGPDGVGTEVRVDIPLAALATQAAGGTA